MNSMSAALRSAGVKVNETKPTMTLTEARLLALRAADPAESHSHEALSLLPRQLSPLKESRKGQDFVTLLLEILADREKEEAARGIASFRVTKHVVFGLSQLVHERRDALRGSRRKSFEKIIPWFLAMKKELQKNPDADALLVLRKHLPSL